MTRPVQTSPYTVDSHSRECSSSPASSTLHWTLNCRAYRAWHPAFNLCRTSRETEMERRDQQHTGTVARDRGRGQNRLEASPPRRRPGVNKLMESLLTGSTPSPPRATASGASSRGAASRNGTVWHVHDLAGQPAPGSNSMSGCLRCGGIDGTGRARSITTPTARVADRGYVPRPESPARARAERERTCIVPLATVRRTSLN
jgi:hypothetical protein